MYYDLLSIKKEKQIKTLKIININLEKLSAEKRIIWALKNLFHNFILSSSFGIQSAVLLHLIIQFMPDIPVIFIDTGYLFPETYCFAEKLTKQFNLNLKIFRAKKSPAWQEAIYGKLWEKGLKGIKKYNYINKVKPMKNALKKFKVKTWFCGLRRSQSISRSNLSVLTIQNNIFKFYPIIDWDNRDIYIYIKKHNLHYNPLWKKGYVSVGDVHTTEKIFSKNNEEKTRFFGLLRECGLHEK